MCGAQHIVITIKKKMNNNIYRPFSSKNRNSALLLLILFHFGDIGESCFAFVSIWTDWHLAWKGDRKPLKYLNSIQLLAQRRKLLQFLDTTHSSFACSQVLLAWSNVVKGLKSIFSLTLFTFLIRVGSEILKGIGFPTHPLGEKRPKNAVDFRRHMWLNALKSQNPYELLVVCNTTISTKIVLFFSLNITDVSIFMDHWNA